MVGEVLENVEILRAGAEGKCVAKHEGKVVFIPRSVPGDIANIKITSDRRGYMEGQIVTLHTSGEGRVAPFCEHWGTCGGCQWQQMDYAHQLLWKQQQVQDAFERIGGIIPKETLDIVGADRVTSYRNKVEFSFTDKAWIEELDLNNPEHRNVPALGYFRAGRFDKIFNVEFCHLADERLNLIRNRVRDFAIEKGYSFFNLYEKKGLMRGIMLRNTMEGEIMVLVMFGANEPEAIQEVMEMMQQTFPDINALHYTINTKLNDSIYDLEIFTVQGPGYITEQLGHKKFRISPKSFFQTNPYQAKKLYDVALDFAELKGNEKVYDLYCGTGSIGIYISDHCQKITGIEYVEDAVKDAYVNASLNGVEAITFHAGDMVKVLDDTFIQTHGKPDVIFTDPPRAGMHEQVVQKILEIRPEKIIYVSCNPATQARDIQWMSELYETIKIRPVDMFPHTHHVENVALLILKK